MRVLFRVDAGAVIGFGHLQRSLSLALALRQAGAHCVFLTDARLDLKRHVAASGFRAIALTRSRRGSLGDASETVRLAAQERCAALVVDAYEGTESFLARVGVSGLYVAAINDIPRHAFPCQLVVNGSLGAKNLPYRAAGVGTRFLLGPAYALLRPEFRHVPPRATRQVVRNVLVTLGGADPASLMPRLLTLLEGAPGAFEVTVIVGPFFTHRAALQETVRRQRRSVRLIPAPDSVCGLMQDADLAISAGGQTLFELAATATPTLAIRMADNQTVQLQGLSRAGAVKNLGEPHEAGFAQRLSGELQALLRSRQTRMTMSRRAQGLIDGLGAERVAQHLLRHARTMADTS